jgi:CheY-like chemotaxis protein
VHLLLVEDDENKRTQVLQFLRSRFPEFGVHTAASLMSGVRSAKANRPELVLLDMTLPNYDVGDGETGGTMHAFGGLEFLKQMRRLRVQTRVIVLTQFETFGTPPKIKDLPELDREMRDKFEPIYCGAVYYHASIENWTKELSDLIRRETAGGIG